MSIRIATQNLWGRMLLWNLRKRAIARRLGGVDIVVMQEVLAKGGRSQADDLGAALALPFVQFASGGRTLWWREGVGVISRWPIVHAAWEKLEQHRWDIADGISPRVVLRTVMDTPLGTLEVYAVHLSLSKAARTRTAASIVSFAARQGRERPADFSIFAGDFKAGASEPCLHEIQAQCGVADVHVGATFPALWPMRRLDYLMISPHLRISALEKRRSLGSDHYALLAECSLTGIVKNDHVAAAS